MSVSYLITLYNKEEFIGGVMDAVLAEQAETGGEIIVYDDASTDHSVQIAEEHLAAHPEQADIAHVIRGETNKGVSFATNRLIEVAAQPYTRLVDGDDVLVRGSTAQLLRLMKKYDLGFIHGLTTEVGNNDKGLENQPFAQCFRLVNPVRRVLRNAIAGASPSLFVTSELRKAAPLPEWKKRTQDFLITLRVAYRGTRMGFVKDIVSIGPPSRTENNLSAALAAMFAEMSRDVARDSEYLKLPDLRYASGRYAARTAKYFRRRGNSRLTIREKLDLWRWRHLAFLSSRRSCVESLTRSADLLDRDKDVLVTGPSR